MPGLILLPMTIDGFRCQVEGDVNDGLSRSVVEHAVVGFNGPRTEDMGLESRTMKFKTLWEGDDYDRHEQFLKMFVDTASGAGSKNRIMHPEYGPLFGNIRRVDVNHVVDERQAVHIDIDFLQEGVPKFAIEEPFIAGVVTAAAQAVVNNANDKANAALSAGSAIDKDKAKVSAGKMISAAAIGAAIDSYVHDITFLTSLPGSVVEGAFRVCASMEERRERIMSAPKSAMAGFKARVEAMIQLFRRSGDKTAETILEIAGAVSMCRMGAIALDGFTVAARDTGGTQTAVSGSTGSAQRPTRADVEGVIWIVRDMAKPAIEADRANTASLARLVADMTTAAERVAASLDGEREITVNRESNIFVVLLNAKVHRSKAEAVCRRNGIENQNRVIGKIFVPVADWD